MSIWTPDSDGERQIFHYITLNVESKKEDINALIYKTDSHT